MLDSKKELTPVVYGEYPAKVIKSLKRNAGMLAIHAHWHDRVELHRIISGSMTLYCGDEQIVLREGDVSVISPRLMHSAIAGSGGVVYDVIMFDMSLLQNATAACEQLKPLVEGELIFNISCCNPIITAKADEIVNMHECRGQSSSLEALGSLYSLLGLLIKYCGTHRKTEHLGDDRFGGVIAHINEHFCEDISAASLSREFGYDEAYFCRKFKRNTGLTVMKYIQIMRLEKARKLLRDTKDSVRQISLVCGFSDAAYFANCFKKLYNMTPLEMRSAHIKK